MPMKKCPVCGVSVKLENLERHVKNQHPHADVDLSTALTEEERRTARATKAAGQPVITKKGARLVAILAVAIAVILVIAIFNPFRAVGPNVGQVAPDFTLTTSSGGSVKMSAYRAGMPMLLEFMDINCEFCIKDAQNVLPFVFANYSARAKFMSVEIRNVLATDVESFKTAYGTNWVYAMDPQSMVASTYGALRTPWTFVLDRNGVVVEILRGSPPTGYAGYAAALDKALAV